MDPTPSQTLIPPSPSSNKPHIDLQFNPSSHTLDISSRQKFSIDLVFTLRNSLSPVVIEQRSSPLFSLFSCLGPDGLKFIPTSSSDEMPVNNPLEETAEVRLGREKDYGPEGSPPCAWRSRPLVLYPGRAHRVTWTLGPSTGHHPREEVVDGRKTFVDGPAYFYWFGTVGLEDETYELGLHHPATTVVMKKWGWVSCAASILPKALLPSFWDYHGERVVIHLVESMRVAVKTPREERGDIVRM